MGGVGPLMWTSGTSDETGFPDNKDLTVCLWGLAAKMHFIAGILAGDARGDPLGETPMGGVSAFGV